MELIKLNSLFLANRSDPSPSSIIEGVSRGVPGRLLLLDSCPGGADLRKNIKAFTGQIRVTWIRWGAKGLVGAAIGSWILQNKFVVPFSAAVSCISLTPSMRNNQTSRKSTPVENDGELSSRGPPYNYSSSLSLLNWRPRTSTCRRRRSYKTILGCRVTGCGGEMGEHSSCWACKRRRRGALLDRHQQNVGEGEGGKMGKRGRISGRFRFRVSRKVEIMSCGLDRYIVTCF